MLSHYSVTGDPAAFSLLVYHPGNKLSMPIEFINEDMNEDLKKGQIFLPINTFVDCVCVDHNIPQKLLCDISKTPKFGVVRLNQIEIPANLRLKNSVKSDLVLGVFKRD